MCTLWSDDAEKHVVRVKSLAPEANYSKKKLMFIIQCMRTNAVINLKPNWLLGFR